MLSYCVYDDCGLRLNLMGFSANLVVEDRELMALRDTDSDSPYFASTLWSRTEDQVSTATSDDSFPETDVRFIYYEQLSLLTYSPGVTALFSVGYLAVFFLALTSNGLVATVIWRNPGMRNVTIYLLANLAAADIAVAVFVMPVTLASTVFTEWHFGQWMCKLTPYVQNVAVSASVYSLVAIAIERYMETLRRTPKPSYYRPSAIGAMLAATWVIPACIQSPWLVGYGQMAHREDGTLMICYVNNFGNDKSMEGILFIATLLLSCYILPLLLITVFYSLITVRVWNRSVNGVTGASRVLQNMRKGKIRIARMLVTVAAVFALSWLPLYSIRMYALFGPTLRGTSRHVVLSYLWPMAQWIGSANSCVNPFIYCYFSQQFRVGILNMFSRDGGGSCRRRRHRLSTCGQQHETGFGLSSCSRTAQLPMTLPLSPRREQGDEIRAGFAYVGRSPTVAHCSSTATKDVMSTVSGVNSLSVTLDSTKAVYV